MKKIIMCLFILSVISCSPDSREKRELIDNFFLNYEKDGAELAIKYMYSTNKWIISSNTTQKDSIANQIQLLASQLGKFEGYELLRSEEISSSLEVHSYLVKYERQPIRFNFILYESSGSWRFQEFQYDSNVTNELHQITDISWYH